MSLKQRAVSGLSWNFAGTFVEKIIGFIVGIILARLLTPQEYGLVGMVTIFIILTQPFINSGFSQALIRKPNCTQDDFSTVFYFNLIVGLVIYAILFFAAPYISLFFKEPQLTEITRIIGLIVIIDAATLIQTTILTKKINFKRQTQIRIISLTISGSIGIYLALKGFGVWSLVYKSIAQHAIRSALLWFWNRWKPLWVFSLESFKDLFAFGSNLLFTGLLDKIYYNIYNLVIAKFFSARELGLYTRADMFKSMASSDVTEIINVVAFPVLSDMQNDPGRLSVNYKRILNTTFFITLTLLTMIAASAESLILALIGEKWIDSVSYLRLLCFVGMFYPFIAMSRTLFYIHGKGRLILKLAVVTKLMTIPAIIVGVFFGIKPMIISMILVAAAESFLRTYYSNKLIDYSFRHQLKDIAPILSIVLIMGSSLILLDRLLISSAILKFSLQVLCGVILTLGLSEVLRLKEFLLIKEMVIYSLRSIFKKNSK